MIYRKILCLFLCATIIFTCVACGKKSKQEVDTNQPTIENIENDDNVDTKPSINEDVEQEDVSDIEETPKQEMIENIPSEEDPTDEIQADEEQQNEQSENLIFKKNQSLSETIESLQGEIEYLGNYKDGFYFIANGDIYFVQNAEQVNKLFIGSDIDCCQYYSNTIVGDRIMWQSNDQIANITTKGDYVYSNIRFDSETDFIYKKAIYRGDVVEIIRKDESGYVVESWESQFNDYNELIVDKEGKLVYTPSKTVPIVAFKTDGGMNDDFVFIEPHDFTNEIDGIYSICNSNNGQLSYVRTNSGDIYFINTLKEIVSNGKETCEAIFADETPTLTGVDKLIDSSLSFAAVMYSKIDDDGHIYLAGYETDLFGDTHIAETAFILPDWYSNENLVDVFSVGDHIAFVFDDGCVYLSNNINQILEDEVTGSQITECQELSAFNKDNNIDNMAGYYDESMGKNIFALNSEGELIVFNIDNIFEME